MCDCPHCRALADAHKATEVAQQLATQLQADNDRLRSRVVAQHDLIDVQRQIRTVLMRAVRTRAARIAELEAALDKVRISV